MLTAHGATHPGKVRKRNEDAFVAHGMGTTIVALVIAGDDVI